jgi:hypothetical protein
VLWRGRRAIVGALSAQDRPVALPEGEGHKPTKGWCELTVSRWRKKRRSPRAAMKSRA